MSTHTWVVHARLRHVIRLNAALGKHKVLQQLWSCCETGEQEWRDVPIVKEVKNDNQ